MQIIALLLLERSLLVMSLAEIESCSTVLLLSKGLYQKHSNINDLQGQMCDTRAVVSKGMYKSCREIKEGNGMCLMKVPSLIFVSPALGVVDLRELWM